MISKNLPVAENRPGWTILPETLEDRLETRESRKIGRARITSAKVHSGVLSVEIEDATPFDLGAAAGAANLSGEICDKCGRKGSPVAPAGPQASASDPYRKPPSTLRRKSTAQRHAG